MSSSPARSVLGDGLKGATGAKKDQEGTRKEHRGATQKDT
jgi:hypothetical protein